MNMSAAMRGGSPISRSRRGNAPRRGAVRGGSRLSPGPALAWLMALIVGLGFVAGLSLVLLVGFRWLTTSSYFSLSQVEVSGNRHLTTEEVMTLAGVELGENTLEMRISDIEARVAADPWAGQVAVRRVLPGSLAIAVTEKVPAWWMRTAKGLVYTEADGSVIDAVVPDRFASLPQLEVGLGEDDEMESLAGMMAAFNETGLPVRAAQAAWVRLTDGRVDMYFEARDLWLSVSQDDWKRNMERLALVWSDLTRRGEADQAREIRIFGGKVWVRA